MRGVLKREKAMRTGATALGVVLGLTLVRCSAILGIHDVPVPADAASGGKSDASSPPGAGDATTGSGDAVERFLGTWSTTSGSQTVTCGDMSQQFELVNTFEIARGTTTDLAVTNPNCTTLANVNGNSAIIVPGQTCAVVVGEETDTYTYQGGSFELGDDPTTASLNAFGTVQVATPQGEADCTFTAESSYVKSE